MFEMLVGYPPFYSDDPMSTCRKVILEKCFYLSFKIYYELSNAKFHGTMLILEILPVDVNLGCERIRMSAFFHRIF